jgi:hypothetical protein
MIPEKIMAIEQKVFLRGYQKFEIRPDGELQVTVKRFTTHNQFKFPLWHLNPNFTRIKFIHTGNLLGTVIFGLCSLGTIIGMIMSRDAGTAMALGFPLFLFGIFFGSALRNC